MKMFITVLALISVAGMIFGWWGHETEAGQNYFNEEAAAIPFFTGIASILGFLIAVIMYFSATNSMNIFAIGLAVISVAGLLFCWWGLNTTAGSRHFDEMAGMIPVFSGIASGLGLAIAGIIYYFASR